MYIVSIVSVLLVSLDALFVGVSLRLRKQFEPLHNFIVFGVVLTMCTAACAAADALAVHIGFETSWLAGGAFLLLGLKNLLAKEEEKIALAIGTIVALGFFVSIDGAVLSAALTIEYGRAILTPIIVAAAHLLFLFVGSMLACCIKLPHKWRSIISASCLFLVAGLNFIGIL